MPAKQAKAPQATAPQTTCPQPAHASIADLHWSSQAMAATESPPSLYGYCLQPAVWKKGDSVLSLNEVLTHCQIIERQQGKRINEQNKQIREQSQKLKDQGSAINEQNEKARSKAKRFIVRNKSLRSKGRPQREERAATAAKMCGGTPSFYQPAAIEEE